MRIHVKTAEKNIRLFLPSCLAMNDLTARISAHYIHKYTDIFEGLSEKDLQTLFREIRRLKKKHPDWYLAEITDSNHTYVKIKL